MQEFILAVLPLYPLQQAKMFTGAEIERADAE